MKIIFDNEQEERDFMRWLNAYSNERENVAKRVDCTGACAEIREKCAQRAQRNADVLARKIVRYASFDVVALAESE